MAPPPPPWTAAVQLKHRHLPPPSPQQRWRCRVPPPRRVRLICADWIGNRRPWVVGTVGGPAPAHGAAAGAADCSVAPRLPQQRLPPGMEMGGRGGACRSDARCDGEDDSSVSEALPKVGHQALRHKEIDGFARRRVQDATEGIRASCEG
ncbi:hypothetical protein Vretifemale_8253 [Volvox reticuliferus]|uniref:Uncharacterized protein n=1 Tax=Volvox reticuliferus TaxID=1737510 RepID=A0A8J4CAE8_9CHLO|nr:hypothetical protein Vretifemale_8253 [Volvox reticuliferus]